jgi:DNA mismatch repair protein MutS2
MNETIKAGDRVKVLSTGTEGEVIEVKGNKVLVALGALNTTVKLDQLEKLSPIYKPEYKEAPSAAPIFDTQQHLMDFKFELDLRGKMQDEAMALLNKNIDDALLLGIPGFKILHGRGTGAIKNMVRSQLKKYKEITHYGDEDHAHGGDGVTVVKF